MRRIIIGALMKRFFAILLVAIAIFVAGCQKRQTAIGGVSGGETADAEYTVKIDQNRQTGSK